MSDNPLSGHFRMPGVHQALPSRGNYYAPGHIKLSMNGEVAVYPMTGADEIILKNPDGLLNGYSIEKLLESCVPDIKNPREIPTTDIDVLLLAIRMCSSGDELETSAKCPKCGHETHFGLSISNLLARVTPLIESNEVRLKDDLIAYLRPYTFESNTKLNIAAFEETKMYQNLFNPNNTDKERQDQFNQSFTNIAVLNQDLLADCVTKMVTTSPDGQTIEVTNPEHILQWVRNAPAADLKKLRDGMEKFKDAGLPKTIEAFCEEEECQHEWETEFNFDPSHFFG